jgi:hypothetical protein
MILKRRFGQPLCKGDWQRKGAWHCLATLGNISLRDFQPTTPWATHPATRYVWVGARPHPQR